MITTLVGAGAVGTGEQGGRGGGGGRGGTCCWWCRSGWWGSICWSYDAAAPHFYIPQRVMFYAFLTMLFGWRGSRWRGGCGGRSCRSRGRSGVAFTASHGPSTGSSRRSCGSSCRRGDLIERNSTFLPLIFSPRGRTADGRPVVDRRVAVLHGQRVHRGAAGRGGPAELRGEHGSLPGPVQGGAGSVHAPGGRGRVERGAAAGSTSRGIGGRAGRWIT